jgi:hypothetical protein
VGLAAFAGRRHRDRIAGLCMACTVKPVRDVRIDQLATALSLDMAQWWQPTVTGYLGRVSKTLICEAVTEAKGKAAADNIAALKKGHGRPRRRTARGHRLASRHAAGRIAQRHDDTGSGATAPGPVIAREVETAPARAGAVDHPPGR